MSQQIPALLRPSTVWNGLQWPNSTVVILASGQSFTADQAEQVRQWRVLSPEGRRRVIAINTTYLRAPWADVLYACDLDWWEHYEAKLAAGEWKPFEQQRWTQDIRAAERFGCRYIESVARPGLGRTPGLIHQGGNGAYQVINLAYHAGARRIVTLGLDLHGQHWHGAHPTPLTNPRDYLFEMWKRNFAQLATDLREEGVHVINCSPGSALKAFPTGDLEAVL